MRARARSPTARARGGRQCRAAQALEHPYLEELHDPDDEPLSEQVAAAKLRSARGRAQPCGRVGMCKWAVCGLHAPDVDSCVLAIVTVQLFDSSFESQQLSEKQYRALILQEVKTFQDANQT